VVAKGCVLARWYVVGIWQHWVVGYWKEGRKAALVGMKEGRKAGLVGMCWLVLPYS
jgi:hypothetical protein